MTRIAFRSLLVAALAWCGALASPAPTPAQEATTFELSVFGGGTFTVGDLADEFTVTFGGESFGIESAHMDNGFSVGGTAGVRFGALQVEGIVAYWPSTQVLVLPSGLPGVEGSFRAESNVVLAGGNLLYHLVVPNTLIEPFFSVGAAVKSYDTQQPIGGTLFVAPSNVSVSVGAGVRVPISATTRAPHRRPGLHLLLRLRGAGGRLEAPERRHHLDGLQHLPGLGRIAVRPGAPAAGSPAGVRRSAPTGRQRQGRYPPADRATQTSVAPPEVRGTSARSPSPAHAPAHTTVRTSSSLLPR